MDDNHILPMTTLDQMICDDQLQALKAAVPYMPSRSQAFLSVFLKVLEVQKTISLFQQTAGMMHIASEAEPKTDPLEMLHDIRSYTTGALGQQIDGMINMFQTIQLMQSIQEMEDELV